MTQRIGQSSPPSGTDPPSLIVAFYTNGGDALRCSGVVHNLKFDRVVEGLLQGKAEVAVNVQYVGERDDTGGVAHAYIVVNLYGSYRVNENVELFARVENLFDEQYQELAGCNSADASAFGGVRVNY